MSAVTWDRVHVGDMVRGADQRVWTVVGRGSLPTWIAAGPHAWFRLRLGDREVTTDRLLCEPAPLVTAVDHNGEAHAYAALAGQFPTVSILEESAVSQSPMTESLLQAADDLTDAELADPAVRAGIARLLLSNTSAAAPPSPEPKRDRFGRYILPDPETGRERTWTRATTVARTVTDEYNLTQWKLRMVAKGIALRPDLIAGAAAADPEEDKSTLNQIAQQAMDRAGAGAGANLGTALHTFTQRLDGGEPIASMGAPAPLDRDLAAYGEALKRHGLGVRREWLERVVVVPELGVAGTLDRIYTQPPGVSKSAPLTVGDLKTGKTLDFSALEIAIQLAIYAHATHMWHPLTREYEPMPAVDQFRALVVHLPVGKAHATVCGVNLIDGWHRAQLAMAVRAARSAAKSLMWLVEPEPADLAKYHVSRADTREALARLWEQYHPAGLWTPEVHELATARLAALTTTPAS